MLSLAGGRRGMDDSLVKAHVTIYDGRRFWIEIEWQSGHDGFRYNYNFLWSHSLVSYSKNIPDDGCM